MRLRFPFQSSLSLCLLAEVSAAGGGSHHHHIPSLRRGLQANVIPKFPYARLVSHVDKENGNDWCLVPKGTNDLGILPCSNSVTPPDKELFLMDREGKIRSKLDDTLCLAVGNGIDPVRGGARLKFLSCTAPNIRFNTYNHDRSSAAPIRVRGAETYCLTQTGADAHTTDTIRTELCDVNEPGFIFDYDEVGCDERAFDDVDCCDDGPCTALQPQGQTCQNYECIPEQAPPIPPGYGFLVSQVSTEEAWCITQKEGTENGKNLGILPCDFVNELDSQLFRLDEDGKMHNLADPSQCLTVRTDGNIFTQGDIGGGDRIQFLECDSSALFTFAHNETLATDTISVVEDSTFCLTHTGNSVQTTDTIRAEPCEAENPSFQFEFRPVL